MNHKDNYRFENFKMAIMLGDLRFSGKAIKPGRKIPNIKVYNEKCKQLYLYDLIANKALLIVTGSLTCPMTLSSLPDLKALEAEFGKQLSFALLYVREAHPAENYPQPQSLEQKIENAKILTQLHSVDWPVIIDDIEGSLHKILDTKPNSVHVINPNGVILFQSLWAGDNRAIKSAVSNIVSDSRFSSSLSQHMMGPFMRSVGYMDEALKFAGPRAYRELALGAPPVAILSKLSSTLSFLPKKIRGFASGIFILAVFSIGTLILTYQ